MSIGLFDGDLSLYKNVLFNLELMKLATYYRNQGEIVALSTSLALDKYSKMFYRKDFYDGLFPSNIGVDERLCYGGYAFTNGLYRPMDLAIEKSKPVTSIYLKYQDMLCHNKTERELFKKFLNSEHMRLSLDGKTIWEDWESQLFNDKRGFTVSFHDYNLNDIADAAEGVKEVLNLLKRGKREVYVSTKFPIQVDNDEDFLKWIDIPGSLNSFFIQYNGIMKDETVAEFVNKKNITYSSNVLYNVLADYKNEKDFYMNQLPQIFKQVVFLRMNRMKFSLIYDDDFFISQEWLRLLQLFNCYASEGIGFSPDLPIEMLLDDTLLEFVEIFDEKTKFKSRPFNRKDAKLLFGYVQDKNTELFNDLVKCQTVELQGGKFHAQY